MSFGRLQVALWVKERVNEVLFLVLLGRHVGVKTSLDLFLIGQLVYDVKVRCRDACSSLLLGSLFLFWREVQ